MAPPKKRPQGKPGQKKPQQRKGPAQAGKPADEQSVPEEDAGAGTEAAEDQTASQTASEAKPSKTADERKAKREAARQERIAAARKRQKAKRRKQVLIAIVLLIAVGAGTWFAIDRARSEAAAFAAAAKSAGCTEIQSFDDEGQRHLDSNEQFADYETNPPTSGPHRAQPAPWGSYREAPEPETLIHNLEHGGVVIHYKDLTDAQIDEIDEFADSFINGVISGPNPDIDAPIVVTSWQNMQECQELSTTAIQGFISDRCNKGPEKVGTTCAKG